MERRHFLRACRNGGLACLSAAVLATGLGGPRARAETFDPAEEQDKKRRAEVKMTVATEVPLALEAYYPLVQLELKRNIETASRGRIYVNLADGGTLGKGSRLAAKVRQNEIQVAQHSISNFSPFAPVVDLLNIPYWANTNQRFVNLVTSAQWRDAVHPKIRQKGFDVLLYVALDPRTAAASKRLPSPIRRPGDLTAVKFRVPGSRILRQFYSLCGAIPVPVPWGDTREAIVAGRADALDPAITALYVSGIWDQLGSVSFIRSVADAQVYTVNLAWLESLKKEQRQAIREAAEKTFRDNLAKVPVARQMVMDKLSGAGVQVYAPNAGELNEWSAAGGAGRPEWDGLIAELVGGRDQFALFKEAALTPGLYRVDDVSL